MLPCDIFCYGPIAVDNIIQLPHLPAPDRPAFATGDDYHTGGGMANTAVWLANWGVNTCLCGTTLGFDEYGDFIVERFGRLPALDLRYLQRQPDIRTPICRVMVTPDGQRTFMNYWFHLSPLTPVSPDMLEGMKWFVGDRHASDSHLPPVEVAAQAGLSILVSDIVIPEHPSLPYLSVATNSADLIRGRFPGVDVRRHAHVLQAVFKGPLILTDSAAPVYVIDTTGGSFTITPPDIPPVDGTGAGDALRAGILYGLLKGWSLERAVRFGVAAGSLKIRHVGAASHPAPLAEVLALAETLSAMPA